MSDFDRLEGPIAGARPALGAALMRLQPLHLRIAFCSVRTADLPELAAGVERGVAECQAAY